MSCEIRLRALSTFSKVVCLTEGAKEGKKEHFYVQKGDTKQRTSPYQEMENAAFVDEPLPQPHTQICAHIHTSTTIIN